MRRRLALWVVLGVFVPGVAHAQTCEAAQAGAVPVSASTQICFQPSADHNAMDVAGNPKVTSYSWGYYLPGALAPVQEWTLGKPTPVNGTIHVKPPELLTVPLEVMYEARVAAIGPTGRGVSDPSNPFYRSGAPGAPPRPVLIR